MGCAHSTERDARAPAPRPEAYALAASLPLTTGSGGPDGPSCPIRRRVSITGRLATEPPPEVIAKRIAAVTSVAAKRFGIDGSVPDTAPGRPPSPISQKLADTLRAWMGDVATASSPLPTPQSPILRVESLPSSLTGAMASNATSGTFASPIAAASVTSESSAALGLPGMPSMSTVAAPSAPMTPIRRPFAPPSPQLSNSGFALVDGPTGPRSFRAITVDDPIADAAEASVTEPASLTTDALEQHNDVIRCATTRPPWQARRSARSGSSGRKPGSGSPRSPFKKRAAGATN